MWILNDKKKFLYVEEMVRAKTESVYQKNRVRNPHLPPKQAFGNAKKISI